MEEGGKEKGTTETGSSLIVWEVLPFNANGLCTN